MIKVETKLKYKRHSWTNYSKGSFKYSSCQIEYDFKDNSKYLEMYISILTEEYNEVVCPVFIEIVDFLYLACGTMPIIDFYKENGVNKDITVLSCRFFPSKQFFSNEHLIDINESTLNKQALTNIKNIISNKPFEIFSAFTALTSDSYEKIYAEHKINLLLQCFDGYIYNKDKKYHKMHFKDRLKEIINVFFEYEKKYNTEILKTQNILEDDYLEKLKNTRHQFSHYIKKQNTLECGQEFVVNFFLLHYTFRIYLLKEINLIPKEKNVEEFFKSIYDWINILNNNDFKDYKSVAYGIRLIFGYKK